MHALDVIIHENSIQRIKPATQTREASCLFSRGGVVIHSAIHRCTAFFHPAQTRTVFPSHGNPYQRIDKHGRESFRAVNFWHGKRGIVSLIESLVTGHEVDSAEYDAIREAFPEWTFERGTGQGTQGNAGVIAWRETPAGVERIGGVDWRDLYTRLSK